MIQANSDAVTCRAPTPHAVGDTPDVLENILTPGVNLSLWQRPPQAAISQELSVLEAAHFPDQRQLTTLAGFDEDISEVFRDQGLDPAAFEHFRADLKLLAQYFFQLSGDHSVKFRLVTTDGDNCRRFHVDTRYLRLLCTFRGPGSEWLHNAQVNREALQNGAPNEAIIRSGKPSFMETFWVGIMKGEPHREGNGLVHRSPPIAGSGQTRVLFCLDAEPASHAAQTLQLT